MSRKRNPLADLYEHVEAVRRFRELARHPKHRKRRDVLVPLFKFFESQLPLVGFVPMDIAFERLKAVKLHKLSAEDAKNHREDYHQFIQQMKRDACLQAAGGAPQDIIKFKLAYPHPWPRPPDNSKSGQVAFWKRRRVEMANQWGCEIAHLAMGLDHTTSEFLRHLHKRLNFGQKLRFLQEFRDKDYLFADTVKSDGFDHPLDGVPEFRIAIHSEINPPLGKLSVERAYETWADDEPRIHKRVEQPLINLVSRLRRPPSPYNLQAALEWYGTKHDPARSDKENLLWLAACVVASENWKDGVFQLDEELAREVRNAMRADKKFAAAAG